MHPSRQIKCKEPPQKNKQVAACMKECGGNKDTMIVCWNDVTAG